MDDCRSEVQTVYDGNSAIIFDDNSSLPSTTERRFDNVCDPGFFGIMQTELSLAFLGDEETGASPFDSLQESAYSALDYLSNTRTTGRKTTSKGLISAEDFEEGPQRQAFEIIRAHAMAYCGKGKLSAEDRMKAVHWLFCANESDEISFDLCCRVLDVRKDVIRLRLNYELWRCWVIFPEAFPFFTTAIPESVAGEVFYACDAIGREISQEAWLHPGISTEELLCNASGKFTMAEVPNEYVKALHLLEDRYILSVNHDNWYLTGRNPAMHALKLNQGKGRDFAFGGSMNWSKLF